MGSVPPAPPSLLGQGCDLYYHYQHPLELWRRLDAYLSSGEYEEEWVAIALEHTWVMVSMEGRGKDRGHGARERPFAEAIE
jgi:hypothetical protein